jgi:hypothetical protein
MVMNSWIVVASECVINESLGGRLGMLAQLHSILGAVSGPIPGVP